MWKSTLKSTLKWTFLLKFWSGSVTVTSVAWSGSAIFKLNSVTEYSTVLWGKSCLHVKFHRVQLTCAIKKSLSLSAIYAKWCPEAIPVIRIRYKMNRILSPLIYWPLTKVCFSYSNWCSTQLEKSSVVHTVGDLHELEPDPGEIQPDPYS